MRASRLLSWCPLLLVTLAYRAIAAEPAEATSLEKKVTAIVPSEAEDRWLRIPWHTNVLEARGEAQRVGKPILLWVMNGNPLGCA